MPSEFSNTLKIPDPWQRDALHALRAGRDVVVQAPTGSGKTHIFEMLVRGGLRKQAVYTVPTRALANDKRHEWLAQGANIGIATGDTAENLDAPVLVATLETQRNRFLEGRNPPGLLVVDEFQMLGNPSRGVNYELVLALAPPQTQLLLLSGSVANPGTVVEWLCTLGRDPVLVQHHTRPVPLEEVYPDRLPGHLPESVRGRWPRVVARALLADLGPMLVFAPRRKAAEELARKIAAALPLNDMLPLDADQRELAGPELAKMLRHRIAFHHSGLSYAQRALLVEPLAKAGALRVVTATTGLAAGINFSMRSVFVTEREYQSGNETREVRPDELLQMFGRAGRRGLDERGFILVADGTPRLSEGRPLQLKRAPALDWPGFIAVMNQAVETEHDPVAAANDFASRLFTMSTVPLGLERPDGNTAWSADGTSAGNASTPPAPMSPPPELEHQDGPAVARGSEPAAAPTVLARQMQAFNGAWERLRTETKVPLGKAFLRVGNEWFPAAARPETLRRITIGSQSKFQDTKGNFFYGRTVQLASFTRKKAVEPEPLSQAHPADHNSENAVSTANPPQLVPAKWLLKALRTDAATEPEAYSGTGQAAAPATSPFSLPAAPALTLAAIVARLPQLTGGGTLFDAPFQRGRSIFAQLDYRAALVRVRVDTEGHPLINPRLRDHSTAALDMETVFGTGASTDSAPVASALPGVLWRRLGLIDAAAHPTRRGIIASYFLNCEGLAVAAALEDDTYAIPALLRDLANLRAGHRFENLRSVSDRLGACCSLAYRGATIPGHLREGVPLEYGAGASEVLASLEKSPGTAQRFTDGTLNLGDIERARLEWLGVLNHIAHAPPYPWERWLHLQSAARKHGRASLRRS